ncbi:UbiH/UbiF family hydroxylase [Methylobacterium nodulans]|uniref:Ubiquinone biosynthesis hydroxylase, UbiH/UbiF/VisC/COQ6 family n=1 Tax=Methylobacterium nodulans (strain LMG 21967 / CNCM I-2342 / ORS 2060) TaxID=460265 RepID=B8IJV5_METNO|nr:UbiH/UbiF family hydroxylase [Methylobacterium nodulans]ACL59968.1 Ubiquinone biosynthesis hydroxylase, UbiH/UbiF/VisC/COQ6 family [Methylobacterium nodulans ORS 2060]
MSDARDEAFDVAVVGAGAAGLATALALSRDGIRTALVGRHAPVADGRTVALLDGSVRLLKALGCWEAIAPSAAPLAELHLIDDTGSLFRPPPARFVASEIGLDAFGWNVESARLIEALRERARAVPGLALIEQDAAGATAGPEAASVALQGGGMVCARLMVAADGARSPLREAAGIPVKRWDYPQAALTTILAHARDHREISTEFHTRKGPFTLVPLPGGRRSSLVWVTGEAQAERLRDLDDPALARAVERQAQALLGRMAIDGPRGVVPMRGLLATRPVGPRLALVGESAHVFPPIGAQGLNLGLRDAAFLRDLVVEARHHGQDPGSDALLARFARSRGFDARLRTAAVDALNRSLLSGLLPADLLRGAGLLALATIAPLRRVVMREGILPRFGTPRLMQA